MTERQSQYPNTFYRVSLKAVIRDASGKVLMNKEDTSDTWNLPGGGWSHGETEHQALARELEEEVDYRGLFDTKLLKTAVFWLESKQAYMLWLVYEVTPDNFEFSVGSDSTEVEFVDPKSLKNAISREERWVYENL